MHYFTFPRATIEELSRGGITPILQKSQLLKFDRLFVRVHRGKSLYLLKFSSNFYEIKILVKTLSKYMIIVINLFCNFR